MGCKKLSLFCGISSPASLPGLHCFYPAFSSALLPAPEFLSRIKAKAATAFFLHLTSFKSPFRCILLWWHLVIFLSYKASIQQEFIDDAITEQPCEGTGDIKPPVTSQGRQMCNQWQVSRGKGVTDFIEEWASEMTWEAARGHLSSPLLLLPFILLLLPFITSHSLLHTTLNGNKPNWDNVLNSGGGQVWNWSQWKVTPPPNTDFCMYAHT